jgi:hypothetical protein
MTDDEKAQRRLALAEALEAELSVSAYGAEIGDPDYMAAVDRVILRLAMKGYGLVEIAFYDQPAGRDA